ncbi:ABC transporter ATP-binding protein [Paenibacillus pasadenensis]|uniref:ABC transporter ATP-binding protein n=1 Tax=Paenibacillus pasadenensis TaxID=217090 RepID=UPI00203CDF57|nr:ABC transporter ATP-binding protein [Paenibacillus pasadenensis]MCM3749036.1 ABC transporter ATP-binding protein [Paenibacillus pasadenensis]
MTIDYYVPDRVKKSISAFSDSEPKRPVKTTGQPVLEVRGLKKKIRRKWIIHEVGFEVYKGEIFGFLGPNGSGKTTTIRMLVDLIKPTEGEILIGGHSVTRHPEKALAEVGCIVENPEMYPYLTGWENLEHFARMLRGVDAERISEVVNIVRLEDRIHDKVRTYSLGMRQRLGIAQALLGRPKLLILDEPTNGLDPKGIKELREFIRMLSDSGLSLFISSHLLSEIQLMCDRVAIINDGRVLSVGRVDELVAQAGTYVLWMTDSQEETRRILAAHRDVRLYAEGEYTMDDSALVHLPGAIVSSMREELVPELVVKLIAEGIDIAAVQRVAPTLEELFLQLTEDGKE